MFLLNVLPEYGTSETYSWKTDIMQSYLREQRYSIIRQPLRTISAKMIISKVVYTRIMTVLGHNMGSDIKICDPSTVSYLSYENGRYRSANVVFGANAELFLFTTRGVYMGTGKCTYSDAQHNMISISSTDVSQLPSRLIAAGTVVGKLEGNLQATPGQGDHVELSVQVKLTDRREFQNNQSGYLKTDKGQIIFNEIPISEGSTTHAHRRETFVFDSGMLMPSTLPKHNWRTSTYSFTYMAKNVHDWFRLMQFLFHIRGRQREFYAPLAGLGAQVTQPIPAYSRKIYISEPLVENIVGKTVALQYRGNCAFKTFISEVTSVGEDGKGHFLTTKTSLPEMPELSNILTCSLSPLVRLNSDDVTVRYESYGRTLFDLNLIEVPGRWNT